ASTSSASICSCFPSSAQGLATSGRPAWVARISLRSVSVTVKLVNAPVSDREVEVDMEFLLLWHVVNRVTGNVFNSANGVCNGALGFGCQYKPHVQIVFAAVVMGHLGKAVYLSGHFFKVRFRNTHGSQCEA